MEMLPLGGLTYRPGVSGVADWLLSRLGAVPATAGRSADLSPDLVDRVADDDVGAGLPAATLEYCTGVALALGAVARRATSGVGVALQLRLPEVMAAAYGSPFEMRPPEPVPAPGGGWVHADLGAPDDRTDFERLLAALPPDVAAPELAAEAQAWRLPVCDYRPGIPTEPRLPFIFSPAAGSPGAAGRSPNPVIRVLDQTNMWAGPLATWLLQGLGAIVTKVEPSFRPDGFRALSGDGIRPDGRPCRPGEDSAMWNALNQGKLIADIDLGSVSGRARFTRLARASDVVIDSFSPRVMPNFGLDLPIGPLYVSMPAFGPGPQREWSAYGSGVHAVTGLGGTGSGGYASAAVSYPDPVAGFTTALGITAAISARRRGLGIERVECSLAAAVQPLLAHLDGGPASLMRDPRGLGRRLLEAGRALGLMEDRSVCGSRLSHPDRVFGPGPAAPD